MVGYLTGEAMPVAEREAAAESSELPADVLDLVLDGDIDKAMNLFHAPRTAA